MRAICHLEHSEVVVVLVVAVVVVVVVLIVLAVCFLIVVLGLQGPYRPMLSHLTCCGENMSISLHQYECSTTTVIVSYQRRICCSFHNHGTLFLKILYLPSTEI